MPERRDDDDAKGKKTLVKKSGWSFGYVLVSSYAFLLFFFFSSCIGVVVVLADSTSGGGNKRPRQQWRTDVGLERSTMTVTLTDKTRMTF